MSQKQVLDKENREIENPSILNEKILSKIDKVEPKSKNYFVWKDIFLGLGLVFSLIFSIYFLADFFYDLDRIVKAWNILGINQIFRAIFWSGILYEFLIFAILGGGLIYFIYRQTDWIFVKYRSLLIYSTIGIVLIGGLSTFLLFKTLKQEVFLERGLETMEMLPYRQNRDDLIRQRMEENNVFTGRIVDFLNDKITVENPEGKRTFYIENEDIKRKTSDFKKGDVVVLKYEKTENGLKIVDISKNNPGKKLYQPKPMD